MQAAQPVPEHKLPPRPVMAVMNTIMKTILRSPLHKQLSDMLMILTFHGRKSGKRYTTPVTYLEAAPGKELLSFTTAAWHKNMLGGTPVTVRVRGEVYKGRAEAITDPQEVAAGARLFANRYGAKNLPRIGLPPFDHEPTDAELLHAVEGQRRVMIRTRIGS